MTYELTEEEKKHGAVPGQTWREPVPMQFPSTEQMLAESRGKVAGIGADRPEYKPMFSTQPGAITPATASQPARFDYLPQVREDIASRATMARNPSVRYALDLGMGEGEQTSAIYKPTNKRGGVTYDATGTGEVSPAQQARDSEMQSRGMVFDNYGNWMPPGGWKSGGNYDAGSQQTEESPDIGSMTIPQLMEYGVKNKRAARAQAQQGALGLVEREAALRRESASEAARELREDALPERKARIGETQARTKLLGTQEEVAQLGTVDAREYAHLTKILRTTGPEYTPEQRAAAKERLQDIEEKAMRQKIAIEAAKQKAMMGEEYAAGGEVRGYADGGAIGRAQTQQLNPMVSQYGQYLQAAAQTGVAPVPFAQYINLLNSTRGAMQQTPTQFADGGDVSALDRPLEGPGTGRSDSIPAVIDGVQPAALSRGEFVLDEETTKYYGTKFLKELQRKAKEALAGEGEGAGVPANG